MNSIKLSKIAEIVGVKSKVPKVRDVEITSLERDSRKAGKNSAFFCIKGALADGHDFAQGAYENGCRVFLCERVPDKYPFTNSTFLICKNGTREALADVAAEFYGHPEKKIKLIGITGTKGKTTTAELIYGVLNKCGVKAGYIGTNGIDFEGFHYDSVNTTPESCDIYKYLSEMVEKGVKVAVIEVSSQALKLGRVRGLDFDICVFTNLSEDHIGGAEHKDFDEYKNCKAKLFSEHCRGISIINADSEFCGFFEDAARPNKTLFYSTEKKTDFFAENILPFRNENGLGCRFTCNGRGYSINFPGKFSVHNALVVIAAARELGLDEKSIGDALASLRVDGRFQVVSRGGVDYVIDYAHNGESMRSALSVLREYNPKRLIVLFGSVGGRTFTRRADLGRAASELADFGIITSDNPDCEPPENIIDEIAAAYGNKTNYVKIPDRRKAIEYAVKTAKPGDIVLLAGKGHEKYQLICGKRVPFSEYEILTELTKAGSACIVP